MAGVSTNLGPVVRLDGADARALGCDFFERRGEKRIDVRRFLGYVCHIAKVCFSDGSLFLSKSALFLISLCVCAYKHKK